MKTNRKTLIMILLTFALMLCAIACVSACGGGIARYELSYARGAYIAAGDMPETKYYKEGETVTLAPSSTFTLSGYTFGAWSDGENEYDGGSEFVMPAHDVKLMATWLEGDPNAGVVTATSISFDDDYLVFGGTLRNVGNLYVYLTNTNVAASADNYVEAEITDGEFTARLPLATLTGYNQNNIPFNLRYKIDSLSAETNNVEQGTLDLSQTYKHDEYNFRLAVNSGAGCVAVYYQPAPDETVTVEVTSVQFDEEYFVVGGTVANVETLFIYLINTNVAESLDNRAEAQITGDAFTVRLSLATLIGYDVGSNIPFNLRYRANASQVNVNIPQGTLDIAQTHTYGGKDFRIGLNGGCVALYYSAAASVNPDPVDPDPVDPVDPEPDKTVAVEVTSVQFDDAYFVVEGTIANVDTLFIYLINTNVAASANNRVEAEITDNAFTARLPLATLIEYNVAKNIPFNLRYRANDEQTNTNIPQGSLDITRTHTYGGKVFRMGLNGSCVALYYDAAPVEPEPGEPDYTISVSSMSFADGKFIIEGTCGADVEKLIFHLHNTNSPVINFTSAAVITDGEFRAEFVLADIKRENGDEPPKTYINVRYELNDDGYKSLNLLPGTNGSYTVGQEYTDGNKKWTLKADGNRTYLNWSAVS